MLETIPAQNWDWAYPNGNLSRKNMLINWWILRVLSTSFSDFYAISYTDLKMIYGDGIDVIKLNDMMNSPWKSQKCQAIFMLGGVTIRGALMFDIFRHQESNFEIFLSMNYQFSRTYMWHHVTSIDDECWHELGHLKLRINIWQSSAKSKEIGHR